ncbi:hypothetical protein [Thermococcus eurythermalis]|nr:hypothetical protein [Thermococcus eurythermalis]
METYNVVSSAGYLVGSAISGAIVSSLGFEAAFGLTLTPNGRSIALMKK